MGGRLPHRVIFVVGTKDEKENDSRDKEILALVVVLHCSSYIGGCGRWSDLL
jgi:hypothetical protein